MIPTANAPDLGSIPTGLLDKIRIEFFSEPMQAAYKPSVRHEVKGYERYYCSKI
jgi:predicted ATP-dependent Lon-type protease